MSYEKPEFFVLSHAAKAVLTTDSEGSAATKGTVSAESGAASDADGGPHSMTSSTGSAYEADE